MLKDNSCPATCFLVRHFLPFYSFFSKQKQQPPFMLFVTFHRFSFAAPTKLCAVGKVILEISGRALMCIDPLRPSVSNTAAAASSLSCRPPPAAVYFPPCQLSALARRHRRGKRRSHRNKVEARAVSEGRERERGRRQRGESAEGGEREWGSVGACETTERERELAPPRCVKRDTALD